MSKASENYLVIVVKTNSSVTIALNRRPAEIWTGMQKYFNNFQMMFSYYFTLRNSVLRDTPQVVFFFLFVCSLAFSFPNCGYRVVFFCSKYSNFFKAQSRLMISNFMNTESGQVEDFLQHSHNFYLPLLSASFIPKVSPSKAVLFRDMR